MNWTIQIHVYHRFDEFIPEGDETIEAWERAHGPLPKTRILEAEASDTGGPAYTLWYAVDEWNINIPGIHACGINISTYEDENDDDVAEADENVLGFVEYVRQRVVEWIVNELHNPDLMGEAAFHYYDLFKSVHVQSVLADPEVAALIEA